MCNLVTLCIPTSVGHTLKPGMAKLEGVQSGVLADTGKLPNSF